jgi:hypothetical protein
MIVMAANAIANRTIASASGLGSSSSLFFRAGRNCASVR